MWNFLIKIKPLIFLISQTQNVMRQNELAANIKYSFMNISPKKNNLELSTWPVVNEMENGYGK